MLAERDSTYLHLNLARRHQRLARRYQQAALVAAIQPAIAELAARQSAAADKEMDRQAAYDDVIAADGDLDDGVRNLSGATALFDREHAGSSLMNLLFPDGGFGSIVDLPLAQEPAVVEALAVKVGSLGAAHALAPYAAKLNTLAQAVRDALLALDTAVRAAKNADAEEELAQAALRRQFELNYLAARGNVGRVLAERMFVKAPRAGNTDSPEPEPPPAP
jgi:hypothetical protein